MLRAGYLLLLRLAPARTYSAGFKDIMIPEVILLTFRDVSKADGKIRSDMLPG